MEDKTFLEYANEAASKIRNINKMLCGTETPEEGGLLDDLDTCIYYMVQDYISPIVGERVNSDRLSGLVDEIMFADPGELKQIVAANLGSIY